MINTRDAYHLLTGRLDRGPGLASEDLRYLSIINAMPARSWSGFAPIGAAFDQDLKCLDPNAGIVENIQAITPWQAGTQPWPGYFNDHPAGQRYVFLTVVWAVIANPSKENTRRLAPAIRATPRVFPQGVQSEHPSGGRHEFTFGGRR